MPHFTVSPDSQVASTGGGWDTPADAFDGNTATFARSSIGNSDSEGTRWFRATPLGGQFAYVGVEVDWECATLSPSDPSGVRLFNDHPSGAETLVSKSAPFARVTEKYFFAPNRRYDGTVAMPSSQGIRGLTTTFGDANSINVTIYELRLIAATRGEIVVQEG